MFCGSRAAKMIYSENFLVATKRKMLNKNNQYFEAQYVRELKANANAQDLAVLN